MSAVCDGMGGMKEEKIAREKAVKTDEGMNIQLFISGKEYLLCHKH